MRYRFLIPCPIGPKLFWTDQIVLFGSKSFWSGSNYTFLEYFLLFGPVQNDLVGPKSFWTHRWTRHECVLKAQKNPEQNRW